jgi:HD-GYP domain-containing protein (c-di-GMP phosphodiesterase class II)
MLMEPRVSLFDLLSCLSDVSDWISPLLVHHQKQVAYIALTFAKELGLSRQEKNDLVMAGMVHDLGALSLTERMNTLQFEYTTGHQHALMGSLLLSTFEPFRQLSQVVKFHHVPWSERDSFNPAEGIPHASHIIHLADRISILVRKDQEILGQVPEIVARIRDESPRLFAPHLIEVFCRLAEKEFFWLDIASTKLGERLARVSSFDHIELTPPGLMSLAHLFRRLIDFRSPFTATHSSGVAACACHLACLLGLSEGECEQLRVAGYFHDLGKLAVPTELLEKRDKLTVEEFNIVKSHTFYTYRSLEPIEGLSLINAFGAFHHERLDGKGYPFHLTGPELPLGSRIMSVADVFTAITEDRPYRRGMGSDEAMSLLEHMAADGKLDISVVATLKQHFAEVSASRIDAQAGSVREYRQFVEASGQE